MVRRGSFIGGQDNLSVPDAPTIGAATAGAGQVSVAFTAPSDVGDDPITSFGVSVFPATGTTRTFRVTVASGNLYGGGTGNVFYIDGVGNPELTLVKGFTYVFDQSDSSNSGHPFHFKNSSDSQYTTGVTVSGTAGSSGATVTLVLAEDASEPSAYYCTAHGNGMGNTITLVAPSASDDPLGQAQYTNTGSSSPITVTGLSNGTPYVAKVWAINDYGNGPLSDATSSFTPALARALFIGMKTGSGGGANKEINYITVTTTGDAADFGDTIDDALFTAASGSDTRALFYEGYKSGGYSNIISYVTITSLGNATDFGDISEDRGYATSTSNNVRSMHFGGYNNSSNVNKVEYVTIASTGNSIDFGDIGSSKGYSGACGSSTRAVLGGGYTTDYNSSIEWFTIASQGNANEFGGLTVARTCGALSSSTRGIWGGGHQDTSNVMDYVTIASTGNAQDFGDLTVARLFDPDGAATATRGVFAGGQNQNIIDYITIASTGNATDFGDLRGVASQKIGGHCSDEAAVQNEDYFAPAAMGFFAGGDWSNTRDTSGNVSDTSHIEQSLITYIDIATTGRIAFFGDLIEPLDQLHGGFASSTRGGTMGGLDSAAGYVDTIQFVTFSTKGKASDFGNLSAARSDVNSTSNSTRGLGFGGNKQGLAYANEIEYITIASAGNSTDFGDLVATNYAGRSASSQTRSILGGNTTSAQQNVIQYVTIASTGNAQDFGDLTVGRYQLAAVSSNTRGVFGGGVSTTAYEDTMDYVTIASTGNATDFGNLTQNGYLLPAVSSSTRGVFGLRGRDADTNVMDYITIASTGNATDWGDWWKDFTNEDGGASFSNSHGGL